MAGPLNRRHHGRCGDHSVFDDGKRSQAVASGTRESGPRCCTHRAKSYLLRVRRLRSSTGLPGTVRQSAARAEVRNRMDLEEYSVLEKPMLHLLREIAKRPKVTSVVVEKPGFRMQVGQRVE